jgi:hypothetical protein
VFSPNPLIQIMCLVPFARNPLKLSDSLDSIHPGPFASKSLGFNT